MNQMDKYYRDSLLMNRCKMVPVDFNESDLEEIDMLIYFLYTKKGIKGENRANWICKAVRKAMKEAEGYLWDTDRIDVKEILRVSRMSKEKSSGVGRNDWRRYIN